jgi:hypothetical protein
VRGNTWLLDKYEWINRGKVKSGRGLGCPIEAVKF